MIITTTLALTAACARMAKAEFVTVDTEFLRESTFWPKLCLVQMADDEGAVLIDALAPDIDLTPLFDLLHNEKVMKVFHSGRQDLEIFWHLAELIPSPVFDTQIAAMALGYGESVSYEQLVTRVAGAQVDKSSRFTDWSRRPLSDAQLDYAAADVTHLRVIYRKLAAELAARGRGAWLDEEVALFTSPSTYQQLPEDAWRRLKARIRKPKELAVLIEVAAWRDREAQSRDVPRSRILKDDALMDIAMRQPASVEALGQLRGVPQGFERSKSGGDLLEAVKAGLARDPASLPELEKPKPPSNGVSATVELLRVLLKMVCEQEGVAPKILSSMDDLEKIAMGEKDVPALQGWRHELFGQKALALKDGKLALALKQGRVAMVEM